VRKRQVYAVGGDLYWLKAIQKIASESVDVKVFQCDTLSPECLDHLSEADREALLLLDADDWNGTVGAVQQLRQRGWRYVVLVVAGSSWRDARKALQRSFTYDYWEKSYAPNVIRREVEQCLDEIEGKDRVARRST